MMAAKERRQVRLVWLLVEFGLLLAGLAWAAWLVWKRPPGFAGATGASWAAWGGQFFLAFLLVQFTTARWGERWWGVAAALPGALCGGLILAYLILNCPATAPLGTAYRVLWGIGMALATLLVGLPFAMLRVWYLPVAAILAGVLAAWYLGALAFLAPVWLLLTLGIPLAWWIARKSLSGLGVERRSLAMYMRAMAFLLLALALARMQYLEPAKDLAVFFLVDCSASMPTDDKQIYEYLNQCSLPEGEKRRNDLVGLIRFGRNAAIEHQLRRDRALPKTPVYGAEIVRSATDIDSAIRLACAFFPKNVRRRIVLISDGAENRGDAMAAARWAAQQGVHLDIYPVIPAEKKRDVVVERIVVPPEVHPKERFRAMVVLRSNYDARGRVQLWIKDKTGPSLVQSVHLEAGKRQTATFELKLDQADFYDINAVFQADPDPEHPELSLDAVPQNDIARGITQVVGKSRVLILEPEPEEHQAGEGDFLAQQLREEEMEVEVRQANYLPASEAGFLAYDLIVLANVSSAAFADREHMQMLQSAVKNGGVGLIMIGGENSFGAGGYVDTPIEETMPIYFRLRNQKVVPNGALCVIMHTCEMPEGNYWTKRIARAALDNLTPEDWFGEILFDWGGGGGNGIKWHIPMTKVRQRGYIARLIDTAQPGDMPDYDSAVQAACSGLVALSAASKHIVLIGDGDANPPSQKVIAQLNAAKIPVTTITVFPHGGQTQAMRQLAAATGGKHFQPTDPKQLPQIMIDVTVEVKRNQIYNNPVVPFINDAGSSLIRGFQDSDFPVLNAHVGTSPAQPGEEKARATLALAANVKDLTSGDTVTNPILAHWDYGLGRATAFTSDATTNWAAAWVQKSDFYARFWKQVCVWTARKRPQSNLRVGTSVEGERIRVVIDAFTEEGDPINDLEFKSVIVGPSSTEFRPAPTPAPTASPQSRLVRDRPEFQVAPEQTAPGRYELSFEGKEVGPYHINLAYYDPTRDERGVHNIGVAVSCGPEFLESEPNETLLDNLRQVTSFGRRLALDAKTDHVFAHDLPAVRTPRDQWLLFLLWALALWPADVAARRLLLDWGRIRDRIWAWMIKTLPFLSARFGEKGPSDPTMAALLAKKQSLKAQLRAPAEDQRGLFLEQLKEAKSRAGGEGVELRPGAGALPARRGVRLQTGPAPSSPADLPKPGASTYTSRLLDAKKRARERGGDDD